MENKEKKLEDIDDQTIEAHDNEEGETTDNPEIKSDPENAINNENKIDEDLNVDELLKERDETKDKLMRALAEGENIRKRAIKDRQDAEIYAITKLARDIINVYDNLQRALDLADENLDKKSLPMIEGLEITKKDLLETFKRNKIEKIEPEPGDKFDPKLHQAMMETPSEEVERGQILQVLTVGFLIGDRLLRASNVTVSSGTKEKNDENN